MKTVAAILSTLAVASARQTVHGSVRSRADAVAASTDLPAPEAALTALEEGEPIAALVAAVVPQGRKNSGAIVAAGRLRASLAAAAVPAKNFAAADIAAIADGIGDAGVALADGPPLPLCDVELEEASGDEPSQNEHVLAAVVYTVAAKGSSSCDLVGAKLSLTECQEGATSMGMTLHSSFDGDSKEVPEGCACRKECWYNNNKDGNPDPEHFLLCKASTAFADGIARAVAASSPTADEIARAVTTSLTAEASSTACTGNEAILAAYGIITAADPTGFSIGQAAAAIDKGYYVSMTAAALDPSGSSSKTSFIEIGDGICRDAQGNWYPSYQTNMPGLYDTAEKDYERCKVICLSADYGSDVVGFTYSGDNTRNCYCHVDANTNWRGESKFEGTGRNEGTGPLRPVPSHPTIWSSCFERRYALD